MFNRFNHLRFISSLLLVGGNALCSDLTRVFGQDDAKAARGAVELNKSNYTAWRDHIAPQDAELKWQQIPWLTTFKDGTLAANQANKPLLFWTMNGHPLGCT